MASCLYNLLLGKRHFRYAPSSYRVCITETQAAKLFGTKEKPKAEACGVFACVYPHKDPRKVVKITRDPSDVAGLLRTQGLAQVPQVSAHYKLASNARWTHFRQPTERYQRWTDTPEAYALVIERLQTLSSAERRKWNRRIRRMGDFIRQADRERNMAARGSSTAPSPHARTVAFKPPTSADMAKSVCPKRSSETASCQRRVRELDKMVDDLKAAGVDWTDIHAGNIGVDSKGRWKVLDMGASTTELEEDMPELAGLRRRRRRR